MARLPDAALRLLIRLAQDGDVEARNYVVVANMGLVTHIAKKYCRGGEDFKDLLQEGSLGLIKAVQTYDPAYDVTFGHYASFKVINRLSLFYRRAGVIVNKAKGKAAEPPYRVVPIIDEFELTDDAADHTELVAAADEVCHVWSLLATHPERHQTALRRRYLSDTSFADIGAELGVTKQRAEQLVKITLRDLGRQIREAV